MLVAKRRVKEASAFCNRYPAGHLLPSRDDEDKKGGADELELKHYASLLRVVVLFSGSGSVKRAIQQLCPDVVLYMVSGDPKSHLDLYGIQPGQVSGDT